jgi:hypothetical protein
MLFKPVNNAIYKYSVYRDVSAGPVKMDFFRG